MWSRRGSGRGRKEKRKREEKGEEARNRLRVVKETSNDIAWYKALYCAVRRQPILTTPKEVEVFAASKSSNRRLKTAWYRAAQKWWQAMRKERSDKGSFQFTERDVYLLSWMHEQFAFRFDHLHWLIGDFAGSEMTRENTQQLVGRWRRGGWVETRKILAQQPYWIWASQKLLRELGFSLPYNRPKAATVAHLQAVNSVRLLIEKQGGVWKSERLINPGRKTSGKRHQVDGEIHYRGKVWAVEVELTQKNQTRLSGIIDELAFEYEQVRYFAPESLRPLLAAEIGKHTRAERFRINKLEDCPLWQ